MGFCFLEEVATADAAFKAWGGDLEEVFSEAARAMMCVMVEDLDSIAFLEEISVELEAKSAEFLLFDFLQEFLFYKDAEQLLLLPAALSICGEEGKWNLEALLKGERIDPVRHPLLVDVKAVTLHGFSLRKSGSGWEAEVIVDT